MLTFPKQLATLRRIVNERGQKLRTLTWEQILALADKPTEDFEIEINGTGSSLAFQSGDMKRPVLLP